MIVTTTNDVQGQVVIEYLGVVRGLTVRSPTIAQGLVGGLKSIVGGKINAYTQMCEQTRQQAYEDMVAHAEALGASAVIGMRYDACEVGPAGTATEVLCYGTAVRTQRA